MLERARQLRMDLNPAERRMWSIVRAKRLATLKFRRQHVIGTYIADFVCLPAKLVIEVDGDTHGNEEAELNDAKRTEAIERIGYRVIRFWNNDVLTNTEGGLEDTILEALMLSSLSAAEKERLKAVGCVSESTVSSSPPLTPTRSPERERELIYLPG